MKCGMKAVALGVFIAAQLVCGLPGQAQSNTDTQLWLAVENNVTSLSPGQSITIDGFVTPGTLSGTTALITSLQASLLFDPNVFDVTTTKVAYTNDPTTGSPYFSPQGATKRGSFTITNNPDRGKNGTYAGVRFLGTRDPTDFPNPVPAGTLFGSYTLTVKSGATSGDTSLYYSNYKFTLDDLANGTARQFRTVLLTTGNGVLNIAPFDTDHPGIISVHIAAVPGPSALLVFAIGAVPALGLLRQRRLSKPAARV